MTIISEHIDFVALDREFTLVRQAESILHESTENASQRVGEFVMGHYLRMDGHMLPQQVIYKTLGNQHDGGLGKTRKGIMLPGVANRGHGNEVVYLDELADESGITYRRMNSISSINYPVFSFFKDGSEFPDKPDATGNAPWNRYALLAAAVLDKEDEHIKWLEQHPGVSEAVEFGHHMVLQSAVVQAIGYSSLRGATAVAAGMRVHGFTPQAIAEAKDELSDEFENRFETELSRAREEALPASAPTAVDPIKFAMDTYAKPVLQYVPKRASTIHSLNNYR